jgi:hypothetical protein
MCFYDKAICKEKEKENMEKAKTKNFRVPSSLYRELESAAKQKGQTLTEYMDDLFGALMCGEVVEHGNRKNSCENEADLPGCTKEISGVGLRKH